MTIFDAWHKDYLKRPVRASTAYAATVEALAQSRFSVFGIERIHAGLGVDVRDVMTGEQHFVVDRLMSENWKVGMQFGNRIAALPELTMMLGEPLESAVKPGQDFTGGRLNVVDQGKLQAVVIQMFRDALLS